MASPAAVTAAPSAARGAGGPGLIVRSQPAGRPSLRNHPIPQNGGGVIKVRFGQLVRVTL
jgi:hypothetical protein